MKQSEVILVLIWLSCLCSSAAGQEATFTLDEVEADVAHDKPPAHVEPTQVIAHALGARRWGMSKAELLQVLKTEIRAQFDERIKVERDIMRQDALYQEAQERYRRIHENYVQFDGTKTGWDVSPVAAEFAQGNNEGMLVVQNTNARDLYFFMHGKLWKWYREFSAGPKGSASAEESVRSLGESLGRGKPQQDRLDESKVAYKGVTWLAANSRVTVLTRGSEICVIFEDPGVVSRLTALRGAARVKEARVTAAKSLDWALLQGTEQEAQAHQ